MTEWPVSRVLSGIVIYLEHALLHVSSDLYPEVSGQPRPSLFDLAPDGVCQARQSPVVRWALTPPFHPDPVRKPGGLLSVALSCGSRQLDVIQRLALWSPDFPLPFARQRLSGPLRFRSISSFRARVTPQFSTSDSTRRSRRGKSDDGNHFAEAPVFITQALSSSTDGKAGGT